MVDQIWREEGKEAEEEEKEDARSNWKDLLRSNQDNAKI